MEVQTHKMSLFHYTWPIFIELLLQMLVGNVDQMMMSQVSQNAVAAIGNANQIVNVLIITFSVISLAMTILVCPVFRQRQPRTGWRNLFSGAVCQFCFRVGNQRRAGVLQPSDLCLDACAGADSGRLCDL